MKKMSTGTLVGVACSVFLILAAVGVGVTVEVGSHLCERKAKQYELTLYRWDLGVGCFVKDKAGKWVPADSL